MDDRPSSTPSAALRRAGVVCLITVLAVGVGSLVLDGFSTAPLLRLAQGLALFGLGALVVVGAVGLVAVRLGGWREPEADFEALVQRSERLARWPETDTDTYEFGVPEDEMVPAEDLADSDEDGSLELEVAGPDEAFDALVRAAVDELPIEFHRALEHVAIIISDSGSVALRGSDGRRRGAYGMYQGDTVAQDFFTERILIFRDTLVRDFGHDPEMLAQQVRRVVRHELAHHLGWGERGVRNLGL